MEICLFFNKIKLCMSHMSQKFTLRYLPKRNENIWQQNNLYRMWIAVLLVIVKREKQSNGHQQENGWINADQSEQWNPIQQWKGWTTDRHQHGWGSVTFWVKEARCIQSAYCRIPLVWIQNNTKLVYGERNQDTVALDGAGGGVLPGKAAQWVWLDSSGLYPESGFVHTSEYIHQKSNVRYRYFISI